MARVTHLPQLSALSEMNPFHGISEGTEKVIRRLIFL